MALALIFMTLIIGPLAVAVMYYHDENRKLEAAAADSRRTLNAYVQGAAKEEESAKRANQTVVRLNNLLEEQASEIESITNTMRSHCERADKYEAALVGLMEATYSACFDALDEESEE